MKAHIVRRVSLAALIAGASIATSAQAVTFDWSYTGLNGYTVNAGGTLDATPLGGGTFQVTSISGTWNGIAISGLSAYYASNDNLVYSSPFYVDYPGLAFVLADGRAVNAYSDTTTDPSDPYQCGAVGYCEIGPGVDGTSGLGPPSDPINQISFSLTEVPEPGVWGLMILGLFGVGAVVRRQREGLLAV